MFNHLDSHLKINRTDQDILDDVIEMLRDLRFDRNTKISSNVEQLTLIFKFPDRHTYCTLILAMDSLQRTCPGCYSQLYIELQ